MSKVTDYIKIEQEIFLDKERENYKVILSIDTGEEDRLLESVNFVPEINEFNTWKVFMDSSLTGLRAKFMFAYAVLFFLENVKISTFHFFSKKHNLVIKNREELEEMIDESWYENSEYQRYKTEEKKILEFIEEEMEGRSKQTKDSYRNALKAFCKYVFLKERETFPIFREKEVNQYMLYLEGRGRQASYLNRLFVPINRYAAYTDNVLNPKKISIPQPEKSKLLPQALQDEKLQEINNVLKQRFMESQQGQNLRKYPNTGRQRDEFRNLVLFRLSLACGLRVGEALNVQIKDLHLDGARTESRYVHIRKTKTNTERKIPLDKTMTTLLKDYIEFRESNDLRIAIEKEFFNFIHHRSDLDPHDGMTPNERIEIDYLYDKLEKSRDEGKKAEAVGFLIQIRMMQMAAVERIVRKNFKFNKHLFVSNWYLKMSIPSATRMFRKVGIKSHQLRHTAIKNLIDSGVSVNKVQAFSGHKTAQMVLRYAQPTFAEVADEITKHKKF